MEFSFKVMQSLYILYPVDVIAALYLFDVCMSDGCIVIGVIYTWPCTAPRCLIVIFTCKLTVKLF